MVDVPLPGDLTGDSALATMLARMKRYRVLAMNFDTRATLLSVEVKDDWEPAVREQWLRNHVRKRVQQRVQTGDWRGPQALSECHATRGAGRLDTPVPEVSTGPA
jgi:hypothetical protein